MGDPFWRAVGNADGVSLAILDPVSSLVGGGATNDGGLARFTMGGARYRGTVRRSKTNQVGETSDVRYLKNGAARAIRALRAASPAGAGLWIAPAAWKTRTRRSRLNAPASRRVSHTALDGTKRRPHAPQARSLYSLNTTSRVGLAHPLRNRWEETRRETSLRSDERSRSPESVFTFPGFGVQLHRNAHV